MLGLVLPRLPRLVLSARGRRPVFWKDLINSFSANAEVRERGVAYESPVSLVPTVGWSKTSAKESLAGKELPLRIVAVLLTRATG